jgi:hypothetical protein
VRILQMPFRDFRQSGLDNSGSDGLVRKLRIVDAAQMLNRDGLQASLEVET